jgi:hypothetical protein
MGVDYVYGQASSTQGELWVVGRDPGLFDYFLPERWERTPRTKLSVLEEVYHTLTKDNIQLVWRVSRVGQQPYVDPFRPDERRVLQYGYNSPFEEVALALDLQRRGIPTTYPRAIYMTGHTSQLSDYLCDDRRYESHAHLLTPDGLPILRKERDYIVIWGYYNKPDEMLAEDDGSYYQAMDALQAVHNGVLSEEAYLELMKRAAQRLAEVGVEDLHLRGSHVMLSLATTGLLICDADGFPAIRICSFDMMRRLTH